MVFCPIDVFNSFLYFLIDEMIQTARHLTRSTACNSRAPHVAGPHRFTYYKRQSSVCSTRYISKRASKQAGRCFWFPFAFSECFHLHSLARFLFLIMILILFFFMFFACFSSGLLYYIVHTSRFGPFLAGGRLDCIPCRKCPCTCSFCLPLYHRLSPYINDTSV